MSQVRVAAAQFEIALHDPTANRGAIVRLARSAAASGAQLVVFPELALTGPIDSATHLIDADGAGLEFWRSTAAGAGIDIVTGSLITGTARRRHNTTHYVDHTGAVLGSQPKVNLWKSERGHTVAGSGATVVTTAFGRVGLAVCWDLTAPAQIAALAAAGADIVAVPAYWCHQLRGDEVKHSLTSEATHVDALCVTRAFENAVAVIFANAAGDCVPCDPRFPKRLLGRSQVAVPFKGALDTAGVDAELVVADIDFELLADARSLYGLGAPVAGHGADVKAR